MRRPRIHLAWCEYCGRKIAWSRRRRQWLALNPFELRGTQLHRRMACPRAAGQLHDPKVSSPFQLAMQVLGGAR